MLAIRWSALSLLLLSLGCTRDTSTPVVNDSAYDPAQARQLLTDTLTAWKQGRVAELARRSPPVRFADDDFTHGWQLADFQFTALDEPIAPYKDVAVKLTLRGRDGKTVERTATYQVLLAPRPAVLRSDS